MSQSTNFILHTQIKKDTYKFSCQKVKGQGHNAWPLTYFWKTNIGYDFFILRDGAFIFGICVPYDKALRQHHKFWTCDLDHDLWPTFENQSAIFVFLTKPGQ